MANTPKTIVDVVEAVKDYTEEEIHGLNFAEPITGFVATGDGTSGFSMAAATNGISAIAKLEHNTTYVASKSSSYGNRFRLILFYNRPYVDMPFDKTSNQLIFDNTKHSFSFNSGDYNYALITTNVNDALTGDTEPMIRKAGIDDSTYRPYNYQAIQNQLNAQGVLGAKNLLPCKSAFSETKSGITCVVDANGVVTLNGTATANAEFYLASAGTWLENGRYTQSAEISGSISGGNVNWHTNKIHNNAWAGNIVDNRLAQGELSLDFTIDYNGYEKIANAIWLQSGVTVTNLVVKPMIRLASDPDDTYAPYAMTNRELTDNLSSSSGIPFKFGIDSNGNYGYIKAGADTVTPFKNPTGTKYDTYTTNGTYTPDVENYATHSIVVAVPGGTPTLQSKTVSPTTAELTVLPDSGYDGLSSVIVNAVSLQATKSAWFTPNPNWSGSWTTSNIVNPDSGYLGMSSASISVPMCRDHTLFSVTATEKPSTVYNGDTEQSNTEKMLRIASTKSGMVYQNSYLNLPASSYMGDATAADVASGKTFSSAAGIQVTGTATTNSYECFFLLTPSSTYKAFALESRNIKNYMLICLNLNSASAESIIKINNLSTTGLWSNIGSNISYMSGTKDGSNLIVSAYSSNNVDMLFIGYPGDVTILQ